MAWSDELIRLFQFSRRIAEQVRGDVYNPNLIYCLPAEIGLLSILVKS